MIPVRKPAKDAAGGGLVKIPTQEVKTSEGLQGDLNT